MKSFVLSTALAALMIATPAAAGNNGNGNGNGNNNGPTNVHNNNSANAAAIAAAQAKAQARAVARQQQRQQQRQAQSQSSRNSNRNANANNNSNGGISIRDRLQAPAMGSFGSGGPCPEGFQISVPGGGFGTQWQCREGKQQMKAGTVGSYFGTKSTRDYLCDTDKSLYGLDHCVTRRIAKSGRVQLRDRAKYGR